MGSVLRDDSCHLQFCRCRTTIYLLPVLIMRQFIKTLTCFSLIGITPVVALLSLYFYLDPFKVLRHYHDYSYPYVIPNRDYISTTMFINNYKKNRYNSFVLG